MSLLAWLSDLIADNPFESVMILMNQPLEEFQNYRLAVDRLHVCKDNTEIMSHLRLDEGHQHPRLLISSLADLVSQLLLQPEFFALARQKQMHFLAIRTNNHHRRKAHSVDLNQSYLSLLRSLAPAALYNVSPHVSARFIFNQLIQGHQSSIVVVEKACSASDKRAVSSSDFKRGIIHLETGRDLCLISCGSMLATAQQVAQRCQSRGIQCGIVDLFRIKPLDRKELYDTISRYTYLATIENHTLIGGLGSCILETLSQYGKSHAIIQFGIGKDGVPPRVDAIMEKLAWKIW